jgi:hypothetical protein
LGLHGTEEGGGGVRGTTAREEEEVALSRHGEGGKRLGGPKGRTGRRVAGPKVEGKILFGIKIGFLNLPRLWKFVEVDLGGFS